MHKSQLRRAAGGAPGRARPWHPASFLGNRNNTSPARLPGGGGRFPPLPHFRPGGCLPALHPGSPEGGGCCRGRALPGDRWDRHRAPPASSSPQDSWRPLRLPRPGNPREAVFRGEGKSLLRGAEGGAGCRRTGEEAGPGGGRKRRGRRARGAALWAALRPAERRRGRPRQRGPVPGGGVRG